MLGFGSRLPPAIPSWDIWAFVFVHPRRLTQPILAGGLGACVYVWALRLYPTIPGWGVRCACVCLGLGVCCAPPFLAGLLGCVCLCARSTCTLPILAGVFGCVCLCARSAFTAPVLAGVCGARVSAWIRVSAASHLSWLACWGVCLCARAPLTCHSWLGVLLCVSRFGFGLSHFQSWLGCSAVCVCLRAPLVPRQSRLRCAVWMCVLGIGFRLRSVIPGLDVRVCVLACALHLYSPFLARVCGVGWVLPGTCSRVLARCLALHSLAPVRVPLFRPAACLSGVPRGPARCAASRPV